MLLRTSKLFKQFTCLFYFTSFHINYKLLTYLFCFTSFYTIYIIIFIIIDLNVTLFYNGM